MSGSIVDSRRSPAIWTSWARIQPGPSRPIPWTRRTAPLAQCVGAMPAQLASSLVAEAAPEHLVGQQGGVVLADPLMANVATWPPPFPPQAQSAAQGFAARIARGLDLGDLTATRASRSASRSSSRRARGGNSAPQAVVASQAWSQTPARRGAACRRYRRSGARALLHQTMDAREADDGGRQRCRTRLSTAASPRNPRAPSSWHRPVGLALLRLRTNVSSDNDPACAPGTLRNPPGTNARLPVPPAARWRRSDPAARRYPRPAAVKPIRPTDGLLIPINAAIATYRLCSPRGPAPRSRSSGASQISS